jgi:hypothetical protein
MTARDRAVTRMARTEFLGRYGNQGEWRVTFHDDNSSFIVRVHAMSGTASVIRAAGNQRLAQRELQSWTPAPGSEAVVQS